MRRGDGMIEGLYDALSVDYGFLLQEFCSWVFCLMFLKEARRSILVFECVKRVLLLGQTRKDSRPCGYDASA